MTLLIFFHIFISTCYSLHLEFSQEKCLLWHYQGTDGNCTCGDSLGNIVKCLQQTVYLKECFCMTLDPSQHEPVVGSCIYTCYHWFDKATDYLLMAKIQSKSSSEINNETCGHYNRQGVLCSECMEGFGLPVYSYQVHCVHCKNSWYNWVKYVAVVYLPLTLIVSIIILFRLNVNSGSMVVYITLSQMMSNKNIVRLYLLLHKETRYKLEIALYSIWNLKFFEPFTTHFCLHPSLSALQILTLDYLVALYPMILVFLTYFVVYWHGRSQVVVCLCRPLYTCLHRFRKEWDVGNSLIEALATLILLSYVLVMSISCEILSFTTYYYMNITESRRLVYTDPSVEYFSTEHAPYVILAIIMLFAFNILPLLLLCIYPCRCFQKILSHFRLHPRILHTLMDAFRGSYKLRPNWLQSFSAIYLMATLTSILMFYATKTLFYYTAMLYILVILLLLVPLIAPYKNKWHNRINTILIFSAFLTYSSINIYLESKLLGNVDVERWLDVNDAVITIGFIVLPIYGLCLLCNHLIPVRIKNYFKGFVKTNRFYQTTLERQAMDVSLPHRLQEEDYVQIDGI